MNRRDILAGGMMNQLVQKLEAAISGKIAESATLDELEKAAKVVGAIVEAKKSDLESESHPRPGLWDVLKNLSTSAVPIVSILTLGWTIVYQYGQLNATRKENEDKQWREFLTSFGNNPKRYVSDVTIAPQLKSFFHSEQYGVQAREVSFRLMGQLTNEAGFRDLFASALGKVDSKNLNTVLDITRLLKNTRLSLESDCALITTKLPPPTTPDPDTIGLCSGALLDKTVLERIKGSGESTRVLELRRDYNAIWNEWDFLRDQYMPEIRAGHSSPTRIDFSNINVYSADFSGVDFSNLDISNSFFDRVNVAGAKLTPVKFDNVWFGGTAWWKAKVIDQELLQRLIDTFSPDAPYLRGDEPVEADWYKNVEALCVPPSDFCKRPKLKFRQ